MGDVKHVLVPGDDIIIPEGIEHLLDGVEGIRTFHVFWGQRFMRIPDGEVDRYK